MEISKLFSYVRTFPFEHGGEVLNVQIDLYGTGPRFFRALAKRTKELGKEVSSTRSKKKTTVEERFFEDRAHEIEISQKLYVSLLYPTILRGWDLVEDDGKTPIELSEKSLLRLPPRLVTELWQFALNKIKTSGVETETE